MSGVPEAGVGRAEEVPIDPTYEVDAPRFYDFLAAGSGDAERSRGDSWFDERGGGFPPCPSCLHPWTLAWSLLQTSWWARPSRAASRPTSSPQRPSSRRRPPSSPRPSRPRPPPPPPTDRPSRPGVPRSSARTSPRSPCPFTPPSSATPATAPLYAPPRPCRRSLKAHIASDDDGRRRRRGWK